MVCLLQCGTLTHGKKRDGEESNCCLFFYSPPATPISEMRICSCLRWHLRNLSQERKTMTTRKEIIIYLVRKECMREGYSVRLPTQWVTANGSNQKGLSPEEPVGLLWLEVSESSTGLGLCSNLLCIPCGCCVTHANLLAPARPNPFWSFEIYNWKSLLFFLYLATTP